MASSSGKGLRKTRRCNNKHRFPTERAAQAAMKDERQYLYRCRACDGWHLTSRRPFR